MSFNLHTALVAFYDAIIAIPPDTGNPDERSRPETLILPNQTIGDTSKKPYWKVSFLGTQAGLEAVGGSTFTFLVQIDIVVKTGSQVKELNDFTDVLWECFPKGAEFGGAVISRRPSIDDLGADSQNSGYRRVMTVPFRASTFSKMQKETSNG